MDDVCAVCRTDSGPLSRCPHCGFQFCDEHDDPTVHRCPEYDGAAGDEAGEGIAGTIAARVADGASAALAAPARAVRASAGALSGRLSRPSLSIPRPSLRIPRPSRRVPRPNLGLSRPNLRIPRPNLRVPRPGLRIPRPNVRVPRPSLGVPRPNLGVPRLSLSLPSPSLSLPSPSLSLPSPSLESTGEGLPAPHCRLASAVRGAGATARSGLQRLRAAAPDRPHVPQYSPRRIGIAVVLLLTVVVGLGAGGTAAQAVVTLDLFDGAQEAPEPEVNASPPDPEELERAIVAEIVDLRIDADRRPYTRDPGLTEIADYHSSDMAETEYAGVVSPSGENVSDRFERFNYSCSRAAQMVIWVDGANTTEHDELAASVVEQWRASEEHATVLESEDYSRVGVGVARSESDRLYVSLAAC